MNVFLMTVLSGYSAHSELFTYWQNNHPKIEGMTKADLQ